MMPNEPYEEKTYEAALRTTKSPLAKLFNHVELGKDPFRNKVNGEKIQIDLQPAGGQRKPPH
jgi:hypothetical protein